MNVSEKLTTLSNFLQSRDFAYASYLWLSLTEEERSKFKLEIVSSWNEDTVSFIYEAFCFVNKNLSENILGYQYRKGITNSKNIIKKNIKKIDLNEDWKRHINFKVKHLQFFKEKLKEIEFPLDLINLLTVQELIHLNNFLNVQKDGSNK